MVVVVVLLGAPVVLLVAVLSVLLGIVLLVVAEVDGVLLDGVDVELEVVVVVAVLSVDDAVRLSE